MADDPKQQALDKAKYGVGKQIRENWGFLRTVMADSGVTLPEKPPSEEELLGKMGPDGKRESGIAGDLIQKREAILKTEDGKAVPLSLVEIDVKITNFKETHPEITNNPGIKATLDQIGSIEEKVPTIDTLNRVTETATRAAESQGEGGHAIANFLSGLMNWIGELWNWAMSGFKGNMPGLWESVSQAAQPNVRSAVSNDLQQLAATDANVRTFLNQKDDNGQLVIDTIGDTAVAAAHQRVTGVKAADAQTPPSLDTVQPLSLAANGQSLQGIRTDLIKGIMNPEGKESLQTRIEKELIKARDSKTGGSIVGPMKSTIQAAASTMAPVIANTAVDLALDPKAVDKHGIPLAKSNANDFADAVADKVGEKLLAMEQKGQLNLGWFSGGVAGNLDVIKASVRDEAAKNYDHYKPMMALIQQAPARQLATQIQNGTVPPPSRNAQTNPGVPGGPTPGSIPAQTRQNAI